MQISFYSKNENYLDRDPTFPNVERLHILRDRLLDENHHELAQFVMNAWMTEENEVYENVEVLNKSSIDSTTNGVNQNHETFKKDFRTQPCYKAAVAYYELGWNPIALCPGNHLAVGSEHRSVCNKPGKVPIGNGRWKHFQSRRITREELDEQFRRQPNANVGVIMGKTSKLVGLDVDLASEFDDSLLFDTEWKQLPLDTLQFTTGRGHRLLYELSAASLDNLPASRRTPVLAEDGHTKLGMLELLSEGTISVMPPSVHKNGKTYKWKHKTGEASNLAEYNVTNLTSHERLVSCNSADNTNGSVIGEGARNTILFKAGCALRRFGAASNEIFAALKNMNTRCQPPLAEDELFKIVKQASKYQPNLTLSSESKR